MVYGRTPEQQAKVNERAYILVMAGGAFLVVIGFLLIFDSSGDNHVQLGVTFAAIGLYLFLFTYFYRKRHKKAQ